MGWQSCLDVGCCEECDFFGRNKTRIFSFLNPTKSHFISSINKKALRCWDVYVEVKNGTVERKFMG